ncbi:type IV pilus assembly PilZ [Shewanella halifaxensis HAW-EB4]|uniref:Type IV pilus assembly PilZ n=1 Tax=Shewanella halifaxensis (strain HAW-EB4) TaxID=458817 RepID=B0TNE6_SHEHH|nr:PilZ domain-containing protein [Shewanella halifaxensis]ABZ76132.1 type IV pilus assembly PilZ [Shewanella halifaxensis HAW-EB4]
MENYQEERRTSKRLDMEGESVAIKVHDDINPQLNSAICIDLSRHGALLKHKQEIALGSLIEITFNEGCDNQNTIKGQVCRCTNPEELTFHIALQLI